MRPKTLLSILTFLIILTSPGFARCEEAIAVPPSELLTSSLIRGYQTLVSPANQSSCPMYPTCSRYSQECFQENNPFLAIAQTTDRLIRCSNDLSNYDTIELNGMIRFYDPVNKEETARIDITTTPYIAQPTSNSYTSAEKLFDFAKTLEITGDLDSAYLEYRRLLSYYPGDFDLEATTSIFNILITHQKYLEAISWAQRALLLANVDEGQMQYLMGLAYLKLQNYKMAREYFDMAETSKRYSESAFLLEGVTYVQEFDWNRAQDSFRKISTKSKLFEIAQELLVLAQQGPGIPQRSPKLAAILGVVPGAGYLYTGYKKSALSALVMNTLLFFGTKKTFEDDNAGLGILLGGLNLGFYAGSIYGSYQTAENFNRASTEDYFERFEQLINVTPAYQ